MLWGWEWKTYIIHFVIIASDCVSPILQLLSDLVLGNQLGSPFEIMIVATMRIMQGKKTSPRGMHCRVGRVTPAVHTGIHYA